MASKDIKDYVVHISVATIIAVIFTAVIGTWTVSSTFTNMERDIEDVKKGIKELKIENKAMKNTHNEYNIKLALILQEQRTLTKSLTELKSK